MEDSCKICYDNDYNYSNPLISPCNCSGSVKWVHLQCLNQWRTVNQNNFYNCDLCKYKYNLIEKNLSKYDNYKRYFNYAYYMIRDIIFSLIIYQLSALIIGFICYKFKYFEYVIIFIHPRNKLYYLIYGNLVGAFIIGIISIFLFIILVFKDNSERDLSRILSEIFNKNGLGSSSSTRKCCAGSIIIIGFIGFILCFTYLIVYLTMKHSEKTWRKELTKTIIIQPFETIPDYSILNE